MCQASQRKFFCQRLAFVKILQPLEQECLVEHCRSHFFVDVRQPLRRLTDRKTSRDDRTGTRAADVVEEIAESKVFPCPLFSASSSSIRIKTCKVRTPRIPPPSSASSLRGLGSPPKRFSWCPHEACLFSGMFGSPPKVILQDLHD